MIPPRDVTGRPINVGDSVEDAEIIPVPQPVRSSGYAQPVRSSGYAQTGVRRYGKVARIQASEVWVEWTMAGGSWNHGPRLRVSDP